MSAHDRRLHGAGGITGGGGGPTTGQIVGDTLNTQTFGRVLHLVSEGPILGFADVVLHGGSGGRSIFFNDTQLQNIDGTYNFSHVVNASGADILVGVSWAARLGTANQSWIQGFSTVDDEIAVNAQIFNGIGPLTRTLSDPNADSVTVTIRFPQLFFTDSNGNVGETEVDYKIEYQLQGAGGWTPFSGAPNGIYSIYQKSSSGIDLECYQVLRPPGYVGANGPWNIRVTRLTADHPGPINGVGTYSDAMIWFSYTSTIEQKLFYPYSAVVGIEGSSAAFGGQMPTTTFDLFGRIVRVPSNYNPTTRVYTGIWDGTFQLQWTDNPVWCVLDMLTNTRYGLGTPDANIDTAALYTISQYCDVLVSDGFGGTHPRYTLNVQITSQQEAYALINQLCTAFMTMVYYTSGLITFSQDSPRNVDMLVTPDNVIDGIFEYAEQSYQNTPNVIVGRWMNPQLGMKPDTVSVENTADIAARGQTILMSIDCIGVNDPGRAMQMARNALYTNMFEGDVVTYKAGLDHADVMPGYIMEVQDPVKSGPNIGGRVISSTSGTPSTVTLDRPVTLLSGHAYMFNCILPNKAIGSFAILTGAGTFTTLSINTVLPGSLASYVWTVSDNAVPSLLWRVISKRKSATGQYEFTAMARHNDKFALIESTMSFDQTRYNVGTDPLPAPTSLIIQEYLTLNQSGVVSPRILIGWVSPKDGRIDHYTVMYRITGTPLWTPLTQTRTTSADLIDLAPGIYDIEVRAETTFGLNSPWTVITNQSVLSITVAPSDVTGFIITVIGDNATLSWDPVTDLNLDFYEIHYSPSVGGAGWNSSTVLQSKVRALTVQVPNLNGTYLIKAVNITGVYSINAAQIESTLAGLQTANTVHTLIDEPDWPGTKVGCEVNTATGQLRLAGVDHLSDWTTLSSIAELAAAYDGNVLTGTYAGKSFNLGGLYLCRVVPTLLASADNVINTLSTWATLASQGNLEGASPSDWSALLEMRFSTTDPLASPTWGPWITAQVGDYNFWGMQTRLTLTSDSADINIDVSTMEFAITNQDRVYALNNIAVPAAGITITYDQAFYNLDGLGVSIQNQIQGDYYLITGQSLFLDGISYVSVADAPDIRPSVNFTVDFWVYPTQVSDGLGHVLAAKSAAVSFDPWLFDQVNNVLYFYASSSGSSWDISNGTPCGTLVLNTWTHIALSRSGNTWFLFQDGVLTAMILSPLIPLNNSDPISIGAWGSGGFGFLGYIDEFRYSSVARWTSNFTPQTSAYGYKTDEIDANTTLMLHFNGAVGSTFMRDASSGGGHMTIANGAAAISAVASRFNAPNELGFTITLYDSSGVAKAGNFNFVAKGYGRAV